MLKNFYMKSQDILLLAKLLCHEFYTSNRNFLELWPMSTQHKDGKSLSPSVQTRLRLQEKISSMQNELSEEIDLDEFIFKSNYQKLLSSYKDSKNFDIFISEFSNFQNYKNLHLENITLVGLEKVTGISKSQVSLSLQRCQELKLLIIDHKTNKVFVHKKGFIEIIKVLKYFFPSVRGSNVKGIPTSYSSPFLYESIKTIKNIPLVWPDPMGFTFGESIEPIYKTVPFAVKLDPLLYEIMCLIDSIRLDIPRETNYAYKRLDTILGQI